MSGEKKNMNLLPYRLRRLSIRESKSVDEMLQDSECRMYNLSSPEDLVELQETAFILDQYTIYIEEDGSLFRELLYITMVDDEESAEHSIEELRVLHCTGAFDEAEGAYYPTHCYILSKKGSYQWSLEAWYGIRLAISQNTLEFSFCNIWDYPRIRVAFCDEEYPVRGLQVIAPRIFRFMKFVFVKTRLRILWQAKSYGNSMRVNPLGPKFASKSG